MHLNKVKMHNFIYSQFATIKLAGIALASAIAGETVAVVDSANKYPAATATVAGVGAAVLIKLIDVWYDNKKNLREAKHKEHATADKVLELEQQEKRDLREGFRKLYAEKEQWWQRQNDRLKADAFEARQRNHLAVNEIMRLHTLLLGMQRTMILNNLTVPEITFIEMSKLMLPVWEDERDEQPPHIDEGDEYGQHTTKPA